MSKRNILIIHQDTNVGEEVKGMLTGKGYTVCITTDPRTIEHEIDTHSPDVILIGEHFKEISGQEIGAGLLESNAGLPLIFISDRDSQFNSLLLLHGGFFAHISQPVALQILLDAVERAMSHRQQIQNSTAKAIKRNMLDIQDHQQKIEELISIGLNIISSLDMDKILETVVDAVAKLTSAEKVSLLLLDEFSGELNLRAERKIEDQSIRFMSIPIQDIQMDQVLRTGTVQKLELKDHLDTGNPPQGYAMIYAPIRLDERVLGIIAIDNRQGKELFDEEDLYLLSSLADTAAAAIENARNFSRSEYKHQQLEAILKQTAEGVIVLDPDGRFLFINRTAQIILGLDEAKPVGKFAQELLIDPDLLEILDIGDPSHGRTEITMEDGRTFYTNTSLIPEIGYVITLQDITHYKELDRIKTDFVNSVSHDLRSPLTAILGYVELIARAGPVNTRQREFIERIELSVNNITSLINDLLDLGRIEAGFDERKEFVNIPLIIRYALESLSNQIEDKNQVLVIKIGENLPPVLGNPVRLRQMIYNLVINAINYTPVSGYIEINAHDESDQMIICISDNGLGIPLPDQPYIFDKFFRASNLPSDSPGTGLGLAIVKSIVDYHMGRIWVESTPGVGTTFTVVLPIIKLGL